MNFYQLPENIFPQLLFLPPVLFLMIRSFLSYRSSGSRLSRLFSISLFFGALALILWVFPLFLTRNMSIISMISLFGDGIFYLSLICMAILFGELALKNSHRRINLFLVSTVAFIGLVNDAVLTLSTNYQIVDKLLVYPPITIYFLANIFCESYLILSGLIFIRNASNRKKSKGNQNSIIVGLILIMFGIGSISVAITTIFELSDNFSLMLLLILSLLSSVFIAGGLLSRKSSLG